MCGHLLFPFINIVIIFFLFVKNYILSYNSIGDINEGSKRTCKINK